MRHISRPDRIRSATPGLRWRLLGLDCQVPCTACECDAAWQLGELSHNLWENELFVWMSSALGVLLAAGSALLLVPSTLILVQVVLARRAQRHQQKSGDATATIPAARRPRVAILIPAHNEESGIEATLATILPQLGKGDRALVVADNCQDKTASLARAAGAEVIERSHASLRGKGYALDFGVRHLAADPPEVVIIVDADCRVDAGAVDALAQATVRYQRPAQALYLMHAPPGEGLRQLIEQRLPWLLACGLAMSLATLAAAIGLLLRLNWARVAFIGLLTVGIVANLAGLWLQQELVHSVVSRTAASTVLPVQALDALGGLAMVSTILAAFVTASTCGVLVWTIYRLMSQSVRQEFC